MKFTVMITTRDRQQDLRRTCRNIRSWSPQPDEVLITADGCTDNTIEMIKTEFPEFTLIENELSLGSVPSRDHMARMATGDNIISLDDDSHPVDRDFLQRVGAVMEAHPECAVVSFVELRDDGTFASRNETPSHEGHYVPAYANCAAAMRKTCYEQLPGFPRFFQHMYEEPDFALQCYGAGWGVWFEPTITIRHHRSESQRHPVKRQLLNARNELWSVWIRCPWPFLLPVSIFRMGRQFQFACSRGFSWAIRQPLWWFEALLGIRHCLKARCAIRWRHYYQWMKLARHPLFNPEVFCSRFSSDVVGRP